ncbi:hypothetical protein PO124_03980 [Bacillus licheniformis]|nr:hypothetical protein [Bacillus licheniformis]
MPGFSFSFPCPADKGAAASDSERISIERDEHERFIGRIHQHVLGKESSPDLDYQIEIDDEFHIVGAIRAFPRQSMRGCPFGRRWKKRRRGP